MQGILLSAINIYPVKSAKGISLNSWRVGERGFELDRRWMVVDSHDRFLTQRQHPQMALITVSIDKESLILEAPGMQRIPVPLRAPSRTLIQAQVWDDLVQALPLGDEISVWLSDYLSLQAKLVFMPDQSRRFVDSEYSKNGDHYGFADAFPFLIISQASLHELNRRLETPLPMNRFRPNLVLSNCEPFAEDTWKEIRIGPIPFHIVKPCSRCAIITVDPATGKIGKEPLRTLATFRKTNNEVYFGENAIHGKEGILNIGDSVEVLEFAKNPAV